VVRNYKFSTNKNAIRVIQNGSCCCEVKKSVNKKEIGEEWFNLMAKLLCKVSVYVDGENVYLRGDFFKLYFLLFLGNRSDSL